MKYELMDPCQNAQIKVIGVGGGGGNAVNHMSINGIDGVDFICANTDAQALTGINVDSVLQIGGELTKGLGAGTNPEVGRQAALDDRDRIEEVVEGSDMIFLTAGMGGGTGTGAISVIAEVAKDMGILTVAVVTKPFPFEGTKKMAVAEKGLDELSEHVDSLITIPNEKLLSVLGHNVSLVGAFNAANDVLLEAVRGISELIISPGLINVDFADVKTVMSQMGMAMMGAGSGSGENRARDAAEKAIACPLLEDINLQGARGILVNISCQDLGMAEFNEIGKIVHEFAAEDAVIKIGTAVNPEMNDDIKVTVVATGLNDPRRATASQVTSIRKRNGELNYETIRMPTYLRKEAAQQPQNPAGNEEHSENAASFGAQSKKQMDLDYLDIPAFLRRQAD
ncbi:MAG: cell division protein FtsZ [Methylococcaceae bacterium]